MIIKRVCNDLPIPLPQWVWFGSGGMAAIDESRGKPPIPTNLYEKADKPFQYGNDATTYYLAGRYLSGNGLVEDWGCGTAWARLFIGAPYRGVDIAKSKWNDVVADLRTYIPDEPVPKIFMRHVLEHNWDWREILHNMLRSFTDRATLILFLKPGDKDVNTYRTPNCPDSYVPGLSLCEADLEAIIEMYGTKVYCEEFCTDIPSKYERIYFMEKIHAIDR